MLRVPIAKPFNHYKFTSPEILVANLLKKLSLNHDFLVDNLEEVILSNAFGTGGNMARYALLDAGLQESVSSFTVDSQCSGGLKSIEIADLFLKSGMKSLVVAGGMESKSLAPTKSYHVNDSRVENSENREFTEAKFSPDETTSLAQSAENIAIKYDISKEEMQVWKVLSNQRVKQASRNAVFQGYIHSFLGLDYDYSSDLDFEKLKKLQSEALIDRTTTAQHADGAAIVLIASQGFVQQNKLSPIARILGHVSLGNASAFAPEGTLLAVQKLISYFPDFNIDLIEVSESYAVIPALIEKELGFSKDRINIFGGALAYGHPFGASGTICFMNLVLALKYKNLKRGIVAIPAAGGLATAMLVEIL